MMLNDLVFRSCINYVAGLDGVVINHIVFYLADPKTEVGKERMKIMTETNDGLSFSEKDLELRGPGDFFGKKQSGLPEFKVADMVHDYRTLEVAREDAAKLIVKKLLE